MTIRRLVAELRMVGRAATRFPTHADRDVDAASAYDEGKGDQSLAYWQRAHRRYSIRLGRFAEDTLL
jgi:uncharacterized protein YhfF